MHGVELTTGLLRYLSITKYGKDSLGRIVETTGMFPEILRCLAQLLNFTAVPVESEDGKWGSLGHGSGQGPIVWNGLVGMLVKGKVDIVTAGK